MEPLYKKIYEDPEITQVLTDYFDFELLAVPSYNTESYFFKVDDTAKVIAQDASGGTFAMVGNGVENSLPIIYINSEGQAGKVGSNFREFISLMISCPNWKDLLKFSGNGQIAEMVKALPFLKGEMLEDYPEIEDVKESLKSELSIEIIEEPANALYMTIISKPKMIISSNDGDELESLFNSFTAMDNPLWRNKVI
ncbi:hypothetical protein JOC85_003620 [Bacillus mesophilus]|uniref:Uncharacterized protein n=1 Tax=Bacillus mesophilus TaxID=1808955 RepID=A0A6M0QCY0_9BACI|nr:hypothetical protein [Bacillus mesophilus]MBM7662809.1 hypothetical protein [Bacillus mesophilus]NEY73400.1 hypothetical protein [Bacillus mesophilus]